MITCRQASQLVSKERDVKLTWRERLSLRLHLLMCAMCRRYERQLGFLSRVASRFEQAMERYGEDLAGLDERRKAEILEAVRRRAAEEGAAPDGANAPHRH
ncbi:MAG: zf-HC2 domain-containing protein [Pseudomonadota bacterium]